MDFYESTTKEKNFESLRFGVLGCAGIARKNLRAIVKSKKCTAAGVASRSIDKANDFLSAVGLNGSVKVFNSYDDIVLSPDVDALYIPLPTVHHFEWIEKAAKAGKHILSEKPAAVNLSTLQEIIKVCRDNKVFFMDGVMFMHHQRTYKLVQILQENLTADVQRVNSSFTFHGNQQFFETNIRASSLGDPLGCLGDLGWYCIRIALLAFNRGKFDDAASIILPRSCIAHCSHWSADGLVPLQCDVRVAFCKEGWSKVLAFDCGFNSPWRQRYEIVCATNSATGTDKVFTCDDFVIPRHPLSASFQLESLPSAGTFP